MAIEPSVRHLGLVSKCDISYLLKTVMLFPLHGFAFHKVIISFCASWFPGRHCQQGVQHGWCGSVCKCSAVAQCHLGLEWNSLFSCSEVYCDPMGLPTEEFLLTGFWPFRHCSNMYWTKAIYVHPSLTEFLKRLSKFIDITVWSSMKESTAKQVVYYLVMSNLWPFIVKRGVRLSDLTREKSCSIQNQRRAYF
jgi:hypothetical protein